MPFKRLVFQDGYRRDACSTARFADVGRPIVAPWKRTTGVSFLEQNRPPAFSLGQLNRFCRLKLGKPVAWT
jgi:hypothetical protein